MRLFSAIVLIALMVVTFHTASVKRHAYEAKMELRAVEREIARAERRVDMLQAEWDILNRPVFLEQTSLSLGLKTPTASQILMMEEVIALLEDAPEAPTGPGDLAPPMIAQAGKKGSLRTAEAPVRQGQPLTVAQRPN